MELSYVRPGFKILYHVTQKRYLKSILRHGIKFGKRGNIIALMFLKRGRLKKQKNYVYLTDKRGSVVLAKHWVGCYGKGHDAIILKVQVPWEWLFEFSGYSMKGISETYDGVSALEWRSDKIIPSEYILDIYSFCK